MCSVPKALYVIFRYTPYNISRILYILLLLNELPLISNFIRLINSSSWQRNYIFWYPKLHNESWPILSFCLLKIPFCWLIFTIFAIFPQQWYGYLYTHTHTLLISQSILFYFFSFLFITYFLLFFPKLKTLYLGFHAVTVCETNRGKSSFMSHISCLTNLQGTRFNDFS